MARVSSRIHQSLDSPMKKLQRCDFRKEKSGPKVLWSIDADCCLLWFVAGESGLLLFLIDLPHGEGRTSLFMSFLKKLQTRISSVFAF